MQQKADIRIYKTNDSFPSDLIFCMQRLLSVRVTNSISFANTLLYFEHCLTRLKSKHSAQEEMFFSIQQERILHHEALLFFMHPEHFPFLNRVQLPQYNPQKATALLV